MAVQQFYYTSWENKAPGGQAGFQVRGMSPGLTSEDQQLLTELIAYRIPPHLDAGAIQTHPVALRYKYISPQKSVLLCSQSNGTDEMGRNGNFFAHALVLAPDVFTHVPPILYWRSPFWRTRDDTPGTVISALPAFDADPSLDATRIWGFLAEGKRAQWLYPLMCAVIHSHRTQKRSVIVDTPDNVALWVAAVSMMLPSRYRPLLSFATYHNDPYRADYLITGTSADSDFRGTIGDYTSFFVLDTATGRTSEVEDSLYARAAADAARPEVYEARMLSLLTLCDRRFPVPQYIDEQLDRVALYDQMVSSPRRGALNEDERQTVRVVLDAFERSRGMQTDDIDDLRQLITTLAASLVDRPDVSLVAEYGRALRLLRDADPAGVTERLQQSLMLVSQWLAAGDAQAGQALWQTLQQVYGDAAIAQALNSRTYLSALATLSMRAQPAALVAIWRFIGPAIVPDPASRDVLVNSLSRSGSATGAGSSADGQAIIGALATGTSRRGREWLALAVQAADVIPPGALDAYYYALVEGLPLDGRVAYRQIIVPRRSGIALYEIRRDLAQADPARALTILERWAQHARSGVSGIANWMQEGLATIQQQTSQRDMARLAPRILLSPTLQSYVSPQWEDMLLHTSLSALTLAAPVEEAAELCKRYRGHPSLNGQEQTLITGVLAMSSGQLDHNSAKQLQGRFAGLSAEQYAAETANFISHFFDQRVTREAHAEMVFAAYNWSYRDLFWQNYWQTFVNMICEPQMAPRVVDLLGFWFDHSLSALGQYPYIVQSFFLGLSHVFEVAQKGKTYRDAAREIERLGRQQPWYELIRDMVTPERKGILGVFRG